MDAILTAGAFVAALTGAGLATGAEITAYFARFGMRGFFGICAASVIFGLAAYLVTASEHKSFDDFCVSLFGRVGAKVFEAVSALFMMCVYIAMISCSGELMQELFGLPEFLGAAGASVLTFLVILSGGRGLTVVNGALGIILPIGLLLVCRHVMLYRLEGVFAQSGGWAASALSYGGYNLLTALPALVISGARIHTKRAAAVTGALAASAMFLMMTALFVTVKIFYGKIPLGGIPMLTIVRRQGQTFTLIYALLLEAAVLSTCFSSGIGAAETAGGIFGKFGAVLVCAAGLAAYKIPFSAIVSKGYGFFGAAAALSAVPVCIGKLKKYKKQRKTAKIKDIKV